MKGFPEMTAIGFTTFGGPEALGNHEIPEPHAGTGQVLIQVTSIAVSPTNTLLRSGVLAVGAAQPPYIAGMVARVADWRSGSTSTSRWVSTSIRRVP
jgi:NADPH2:quinone reductase